MNSKLSIKRVLVVRFGSLGDIILTTPVLRTIKYNFPNTIIYFLMKEEYKRLALLMPHLDVPIFFKKGDSILQLSKILNYIQFDLVVDLHSNLRSLGLLKLLNSPYKVRYPK